MREARSEVLVIGAGPVGLWTALSLAESGVQTSIIDQEERTTTRSYACALHPHTLELLQRANLLEPVLAQGRRVDTLAFYDEQTCRAEIDLGKIGSPFPFLVILPQSALEGLLEQRLKKLGVPVQWNNRFDSIRDESADLVWVTIEELGGTGTGYIVPHWESVVKDRFAHGCQFLIGADGYSSIVRQRLGIDFRRVTGPVSFAAYEFKTDQSTDSTLRVVLGETTNVLWPMPDQKCRWTFQIVRGELPEDFPHKERRSARLAQANVDERIRQYVQQVGQKRAPWFKAGVTEITWCTEVAFEQRLATSLGRDRCWLLGDAAHQTGPAGVQSMNEGFAEGAMLAGIITRTLREQPVLEGLPGYERAQRGKWECLLGVKGGLVAQGDTDPWVRDHANRMLPCLPGSGPHLKAMAAQLKLDVTPNDTSREQGLNRANERSERKVRTFKSE